MNKETIVLMCVLILFLLGVFAGYCLGRGSKI